jgi:hypothetical protein
MGWGASVILPVGLAIQPKSVRSTIERGVNDRRNRVESHSKCRRIAGQIRLRTPWSSGCTDLEARVSHANAMRRVPRPCLAMGFRRHKGLGLFDCGPRAHTRLGKRAGVRPRSAVPMPRESLATFEPACLSVRLMKRELGGVSCKQSGIGSTTIPIALAVLVVGIGMVEVLALII